jgi:hypothetical protein
MSDDAIDVGRLIDEIDDEVRRRRDDGSLDPAFEQELDELFSIAAPPGVTGDFPRLLDEVLRRAAIDATPPTASNVAGGAAVKRLLGRTMSWYVESVTRQVASLGGELVEALRILGERVARLERAVPAATDAAAPSLAPHVDLPALSPSIVTVLHGTRGRVLHGDAGSGVVVRALVDDGVDAYGVEPRPRWAERAAVLDVDVREQSVASHLAQLPRDSLGGMVLTGWVDTAPNDVRTEVVRAARRTLVSGAPCVVVTWEAAAWGDATTSVTADLAVGRPWHEATWTTVLEREGFDVVPVTATPSAPVSLVVARRLGA